MNGSSGDLSFEFTTNWDYSAVGSWTLDSLLTEVDRDGYHYRWSNRIQYKPLGWFEFGYSTHYWFDSYSSDSQRTSNSQQAADIQISLPEIDGISHRLYGETLSSQQNELESYVLGWSGQISFCHSSLRMVLESQSVDNKNKLTTDATKNSLSSAFGYQYKHSVSVASYVQLANDHQFSLIVSKQYGGYMQDERSFDIDYQIPFMKGRLMLGAGFSSLSDQSIWSRYQFRF